MKLFQYPNGILLKRKNKRNKLITSLINPENNYLEMKVYSKEGIFASFKEIRGLQTVVMCLTDETLEILAQIIIHHLEKKRK